MALRLARTSAEAHLYMELHPCDACGEQQFEPADSVIEVDGDLASRYAGPCPGCGAAREFVFRLPQQIIMPSDDDPRFGDNRPSELLDAAEWLWVADVIASGVPPDQAGLTGEERRLARIDLLTAASALSEVLKFAPEGADAVPADAVWSSRGSEIYTVEPGRFRRARLEVVRQTYLDLASRFAN
ncbi:hypothetical protein GCM10010399_25250 [Dactylosporangium fulvum]|uniref:Uncharacterized protein n=1 Tax=Dactylosporangium fulvum TaxID=53359 RepID=A0ABY5W6C0_9ACTN|nr:hypothetical protein [Dactylosporangium fulvum]UWP85442.1 hypothetical protein Dfulv_14860 [Dactylosporangium fulvum]